MLERFLADLEPGQRNVVLVGLFVSTWGGIAFAFLGGGLLGGLVWIVFGFLLSVLLRNFLRKPRLASETDALGIGGESTATADGPAGETAEQRVLRRLEAMKAQGDAPASAD